MKNNLPVMPGSHDPRRNWLRWEYAVCMSLTFAVVDLDPWNLKALLYSAPTHLLLIPIFALVLARAMDRNLMAIGLCHSFREQAHLLAHRAICEAAVITLVVKMAFFVFRMASGSV